MGRHYDLARQMCNYWANFIKTGDPNGKDADGSPMPEWRPYSAEAPCEMVFSPQGAAPVCDKESSYKLFLMEKISEDLSGRA